MYDCDWCKWDAGHQEGRSNLSKDKEIGKLEALEEQVIKETHTIPFKTGGSVLVLRRRIGGLETLNGMSMHNSLGDEILGKLWREDCQNKFRSS